MELDDIKKHDVSAFMVSKANVSRYNEMSKDQSRMIKDGNVLDLNYLKTEEDDSYKEPKKNLRATESGDHRAMI